MNSLKSFVKNIAEKAQSDFSPVKSFTSDNSRLEVEAESDAAEGFICPSCMRGFTLPEELERHYMVEHSNATPATAANANTNFADLNDEVKELQTTLKEEQWYSAELKKEVERLSNAVQRSRENSGSVSVENGVKKFDDDERIMFESQVAALEQAKSLLTNEVSSLKESLDQSELKIRDLERFSEKVAQVSAENVGLKAALDEMSGIKAAFEEKNKILETVLSQRNNSDDVAVLRRELQNVQKLMVSDLGDQSMYSDLIEENEKLRQEVRHLKETESQLNSGSADALEEMKQKAEVNEGRLTDLKSKVVDYESQLSKAKDDLKQLEAESENKSSTISDLKAKTSSLEDQLREEISKQKGFKVESEKLQSRFSHQEKKLSELNTELSTTQKNYSAQCQISDQLKSQIINLSANIEELTRQISSKESEVDDLKKETSSLKQEIDRLDSERETLLSKIEAGDGVNTALQQLKQQNELLSDQLETLSADKQSSSASYEAKLKDLHSKLQEVKTNLAETTEALKKTTTAKDDYEAKFESLKKEFDNLEGELQTKAESLLAIESATSLERQELKNRVDSLSASVSEKISAIQSLESKQSNLQLLLQEEKDKSSNLEKVENASVEKIRSLEESQTKIQAQLHSKTSDLKKVIEEKNQLETERSSLRDQIAGLQVQAQTAGNQLLVLKDVQLKNEQLVKDVESTKAERDRLIQQTKNLEKDLEEKSSTLKQSQSQLQQSQESIKELKIKIEGLIRANDDLEGALKDKSAEVQGAEDSLRDSRVELDKLKSSLEEAEKINKDFLTTIEENIKSISILEDEKKDLGIRLSDKSSMLDALNQQLSVVEATLSDRSSELESLSLQLSDKEESMKRMKSSWEAEKNQQFERIHDLENAKELLLSSKVDLQKQVDDFSQKFALVQKEMNSNTAKTEEERKQFKIQLQNVKDEMGVEIRSLKEELDKEMTRSSLISKAISDAKEQLARAESRAVQAEAKFYEMNQNYDSALSAKLELEAKVESAADERRSLLERCLGAESELERIRSVVVELRRKLDDSQAALHELGRENQSIQVELAKQSGRKWADDSEVNNCHACRSAFSLTTRKHHCRNCGKIFCADCSNKQANMPDYKKPQRVCETCHAELQQAK